MVMGNIVKKGAVCALLFLLSFAVYFPPKSTVAAERSYSFGVVPQYESRRIQHIWRPLLRAVGELAGVRFELAAAPSIPAFEDFFLQGVYDFAYMNPYHLLKAHEAQGYIPLVRDVGRSLYGVIVVRKDSPFTSVYDLEGSVVAFPAPNALAAALIPRAVLAGKLDINITPKYVNNHTSVYLNVALRQVDAGGGVQSTLARQKDTLTEQLRILYKTDKTAPHPVAGHPRVPDDVVAAVSSAFLQLGSTEQGRALLRKAPIHEIGAAAMADYAPLREMGLDAFYVKGGSL